VSPWLVAGIWLVWFALAAGAGYAPVQKGDRIDDRATTVSVWADLATLVSLLAAVAVAVFVPRTALPVDPWLSVSLGALLVALGIALRQWAARTLGSFFTRSILVREQHQMVTTGPYRFVRHPAYAGLLISVVGLALTLGNWLSVVVAVLGFLLGNIPRIKAEDAVLEANLGDQYRDYARAQQRLLPGIW
jgi:protein-S-isoprenylcysteine O-methyltransferase Ste14